MTLATEHWLPVVGFEGAYEVSDLGRVRSVDRIASYVVDGRTRYRRRRGCILKPGTVKSGHQLVVLGRGNSRLVHALVLTAFVGPRPPGFDSLHGDGDPANNRLTNLRWGTRSENMQDAVRHGVHRSGVAHGEASHLAILTEADVAVIRELLGAKSHREIAAQFGVHHSTISKIATGRNWAHLRRAA